MYRFLMRTQEVTLRVSGHVSALGLQRFYAPSVVGDAGDDFELQLRVGDKFLVFTTLAAGDFTSIVAVYGRRCSGWNRNDGLCLFLMRHRDGDFTSRRSCLRERCVSPR